MFAAQETDPVGKAVCQLIDTTIPANESLKESDFSWYVEDLQTEIINYFNYHRLVELPQFLERLIYFTKCGSVTDDRKRRYAASVVLATIISLFPFDEYIPQFEPIIEQLLRPGFKRTVTVGAMVAGSIGYLSGRNRDHLVKVLVQKSSAMLASKAKPDQLFAAAILLKELAESAPEQIFALGGQFHMTISAGLQNGDVNVKDLCIQIVATLFKSQSASVGLFFLTDFLALMRKEAAKRLEDSRDTYEIVANLKLLQILLKQRPSMKSELAKDLVYPVCVRWITSPVLDIMKYSIETIMFLHKSGTIVTSSENIKVIMGQLFLQTQKHPGELQDLFTAVIESYPEHVREDIKRHVRSSAGENVKENPSESSDMVAHFNNLLKLLPKNAGPPLVFHLLVSTIRVVEEEESLKVLFPIVQEILTTSTVATPIHLLLQALNETKDGWHLKFRRFKQFLVRMIHEELSEPFPRWESRVISFNAIDQLNNLSYSDAVMLHGLVMDFADSTSWQIRERVASSAIHLYKEYMDKFPLESMKRLVDLAVDDPVRSVRKKTLFSFDSKDVYKFLAQPEIIDKFWSLIHDESYMLRKRAIDMLGELIPHSDSILREMLLTTLRQLPDKYNLLIPARISENFPHLIWASRSFLHLYASAVSQRFLKMLNERFNNPMYKDQSLVYMNSAQLRDIDGSIIKALARVNEICPEQCPSGPIIRVLSTILLQPVHPWTKTHALKALKNIAQGAEEIGFIVKEYPKLVQALLKLIRENSSIKLVTKSLKVLGAIGALDRLPPVLSKSKDIFIFRSFFYAGSNEFKRYYLRLTFHYLFDIFDEPMIDSKKETIAKVITDLFEADPESVSQYLHSFVNVFLPSFSQPYPQKTLKVFMTCLTTVIQQAGRLIVPHVSAVFQAIEQHWRQQFTVEASRIIQVLIEAAYGECDTILHMVVPICFQLIKFKGQNSALELFDLLMVVANYTPSYISIIVEEISDIAGYPETPDAILGKCIETLMFIVKKCDCFEFLPIIKRCVIKLKNNAGVRYRDAATSLLKNITEKQDDESEDDWLDDKEMMAEKAKDEESKDDQSRRAPADSTQLVQVLELPQQMDDVTFGKWYQALETKLMEVSPSAVVQAMKPLSAFSELQPKFSFIFAFLTMWLTINDRLKDQIARALKRIFKCDSLPGWIAIRLVNLVEFSVLSEIDLHLDMATLINFCEKRHLYAKALLFVENSSPIFTIQKIIALNSAVNRKIEARALAKSNSVVMDHKLWMDLGDWKQALNQIKRSVDPSRYVYHRVVCKAALEDWKGILKYKDCFSDLNYHDGVQIAGYFMTAEMWNGDAEAAVEFMNATNGFSVEDQIMRATVLIRLEEQKEEKHRDYSKASKAVHMGWRYLAASVSAIEKCNKNAIQEQLFQAQELLELSEVLLCLREPSFVDSMNRVWSARLKNIENAPDKQKQLIKIRHLVPKVPGFDAHMLNIISYYIWLEQPSVARRLADIFFTEEDTYHRQYVDLELSGREEKIQEILDLAETCKSQELGIRLQQLAGNIKLKKCSTIEGLQDVAKHFALANKSQEKIADVNTLLAHATGDASYAARAAEAIGKVAKHKGYKHVLFAHKLLGLATNFSEDKDTCQAVGVSLASIPPSGLQSVMYSAFSLLLHPSEFVQEAAYEACEILISKYPQHSGFLVLAMEAAHSENECLEELFDKLQMDHPVTFSQVSTVASQLIRISSPIHRRLKEKISGAAAALEAEKMEEAFAQIKAAMQILNDPNMSLLEKQLKSGNDQTINELWAAIKRDRQVTKQQILRFEEVMSLMLKKYESMRVIKLSSVSEQLERKSKWNIFVLGRQSLKPDGVTISKFYHCIGNLESGFQITIIGSDGKRYNYIMRPTGDYRPLAILQFVNLIGSLIIDVHLLTQGSIIELNDKLHIYEMPKNHISMHEMVTRYRCSKQRVQYPEEALISAQTGSLYKDLSTSDRINVLGKMTKHFDATELARALLVTSRDADAWAHRTSEFASSLGALSAVCYIVGTVNHTPSNFLIDKTTGAVTFSTFSGVKPNQPVPFRLTPMIEKALGRYGVQGPFSRSFSLSMKEIRKRARALAPFLQFTTGAPPFSPPQVPSKLLQGFGIDVVESVSDELNEIYQRILGMDMSPEDELNELVGRARSLENIAQMPGEWYPWW